MRNLRTPRALAPGRRASGRSRATDPISELAETRVGALVGLLRESLEHAHPEGARQEECADEDEAQSDQASGDEVGHLLDLARGTRCAVPTEEHEDESRDDG